LIFFPGISISLNLDGTRTVALTLSTALTNRSMAVKMECCEHEKVLAVDVHMIRSVWHKIYTDNRLKIGERGCVDEGVVTSSSFQMVRVCEQGKCGKWRKMSGMTADFS